MYTRLDWIDLGAVRCSGSGRVGCQIGNLIFTGQARIGHMIGIGQGKCDEVSFVKSWSPNEGQMITIIGGGGG